jgi:hypothetical protein
MARRPRLPSPATVGFSPSEELLDQTIGVWQPHSKRRLTHDDAREIATNMVGFFQVLMDWDREEKSKGVPAQNEPQAKAKSPKNSKPGGSS